MTLGERLIQIVDDLPMGWAEADVLVHVESAADADRAALMLGSLSPGRSGRTFRITLSPGGRTGASVDAARKSLDRLEDEGIDARIALSEGDVLQVETPAAEPVSALAAAWDDVVPRLPADWSDLYLEVELRSSEEIERASLLLSPVNPFLVEHGRPGLRFRAARRAGYGAAAPMARRCLARLDEEQIAGTLRVLRVQSETRHVLTQGPVWREAGRAV